MNPYSKQAQRRQAGLTLVEVLVALVVTLILAIALIRVFKIIGDAVNRGRATLEINSQLRTVSHRLQADLDMLTVPVRPWPTMAGGLGYFEFGEGICDTTTTPRTVYVSEPHESLRSLNPPVINTLTGDVDDYVAFTARSEDEPFVGQIFDPDPNVNGFRTIRSNVAEIIWWVSVDPTASPTSPYRYRLHRRVLLVRPDLNSTVTGLWRNLGTPGTVADIQRGISEFLNVNDLSVRFDTYTNSNGTTYGVAANSLADLTRREYRFGRNGTQVAAGFRTIDQTQYPFYPNIVPYVGASLFEREQQGSELGEDLMLTNVLSLDVRAFDPTAPIYPYNRDAGDPVDGIETIAPGDSAFASTNLNPANVGSLIGRGAFVDLHYGNPRLFNGVTSVAPSYFSGSPHPKSNLAANATQAAYHANRPFYDTWTYHYEQDGINQNGNAFVDEATDGFDNDNVNGVDDAGERETSPPYPFPLRGLQVKIRAIEPTNRIVRQMTITADFVPE